MGAGARGVEAEQRYVPGMPVAYGSIATRGRNTVWVSEAAPPMMSLEPVNWAPWARSSTSASVFSAAMS